MENHHNQKEYHTINKWLTKAIQAKFGVNTSIARHTLEIITSVNRPGNSHTEVLHLPVRLIMEWLIKTDVSYIITNQSDNGLTIAFGSPQVARADSIILWAWK